ncbi:MAG: hypothetical protein ACRDJW_00570 [Thermomicrobiales bacterium]
MSDQHDWFKGLMLGMVGGAIGTTAMGYYWRAASALTGSDPRTAVAEDGPHALDDISLVSANH